MKGKAERLEIGQRAERQPTRSGQSEILIYFSQRTRFLNHFNAKLPCVLEIKVSAVDGCPLGRSVAQSSLQCCGCSSYAVHQGPRQDRRCFEARDPRHRGLWVLENIMGHRQRESDPLDTRSSSNSCWTRNPAFRGDIKYFRNL